MSDFASLLSSFVDVYERDPAMARAALDNCWLGIEYNEENEYRYKNVKDALEKARERSAETIRARILSVLGDRGLPSLPTVDNAGPSSLEYHYFPDEYGREQTEEFKDALAAVCGMQRTEFDKFALEEGMSDDFLDLLRQEPRYREIHAWYKSNQLSKANLHIFFAREFISWVDVAVAQIENLLDVKYKDSIPAHLRQFIGEAYRCYLYGFDAACTSLCGSIIQEAIRFKLGRVGFTGLKDAIDEAEGSGLLTPKAVDAAEEVMRMRNLAAHGKQQFAHSPEDRRKSPLPLTREILDTVFATE